MKELATAFPKRIRGNQNMNTNQSRGLKTMGFLLGAVLFSACSNVLEDSDITYAEGLAHEKGTR